MLLFVGLLVGFLLRSAGHKKIPDPNTLQELGSVFFFFLVGLVSQNFGGPITQTKKIPTCL